MEKIEALDSIKRTWSDEAIPLGEKIATISGYFYSVGLDLATTAAYIRATPSELDALLSMGDFDEDLLCLVSEVNPPKTVWTFLSSASSEEVERALVALRDKEKGEAHPEVRVSVADYVYATMVEVAGPTTDQILGNLSGASLLHALKKAEDYGAVNEKSRKFLKNIAGQKKRGKTLSEKQIVWLKSILEELVSCGAITRNSIDGDQEFCDEILDALEK